MQSIFARMRLIYFVKINRHARIKGGKQYCEEIP